MIEIQLTNTLSGEKTPVVADANGRVGMYVCGPTVYDRAHIGNARPVVVFDLLFRLLRHVYGEQRITYVRNFTDVDDKIIKRADETGRPIGDITTETSAWYLEDMAALGALEPNIMPRATAFVSAPEQPTDMIRLIETLIDKGHAYAAEGHVLFSVKSWEPYGSLAHRSLDEMMAGARVEVAPYKRDAMDFVLWKPSTPEQPGWESPWGRGRPGWHIECSAMVKATLGDRIQIHGGGIDLAFPHHENERAQSCCANGTDEMADIWVHNGYLMVEGEKMSKSLGNFFTVKDLRDRGIPGLVIRYLLLSTHYRQPIDWTEKRVEEATRVINRWRRALDHAEGKGTPPEEAVAALADDLNSWTALRAIDAEAKRVLEPRDEAEAREASAAFLGGLALMGFEGLESASHVEEAAKGAIGDDQTARIEALLAARVAARKSKDFALADGIRDGLSAAGVVVKDGPEGTAWELGPAFDPAKLTDLESLR
ncbi:MAG: cysteine--tRNA ligase [Pseudomonadota bacterium]